MRKRLSVLLILTLVISIFVMPVSVADSHDPMVFDLFAGQNIDVGKVEVWNDHHMLYVKYVIDVEGWEMTESHLSVTDSLADIPKTKTGNAIPGQFAFSEYHDPAVTVFEYEINLMDLELSCDELVIAAHAAVQHFSEADITPEITWTRSQETDNDASNGIEVLSTTGLGGNWEYNDVIGEFTTMDAIVWDQGDYEGTDRSGDPGYPYASWKHVNTGATDLRLFRAEFDLDPNFVVYDAVLSTPRYVNAIPINDNLYVYVNEALLFWGGTRANTIGTHEAMSGVQATQTGPFPETDNWFIPGEFPEIDGLVAGGNKIEVFTEENAGWGGMGELELTLSGIMYDQWESAWAAEEAGMMRINPDPKGNWGTYFNFTCHHCENPTLINAGFEFPNLASGTWGLYPETYENLGWDVEWVGTHATTPVLEIQDSLVPADEGTQYAELGSNYSIRISQDVSTCMHHTYEVTFAIRARVADDRINFLWNGVKVGDTYTALTTEWTTITVSGLVPTGSTSTIGFEEVGASDNSYGMYLDDITIMME